MSIPVYFYKPQVLLNENEEDVIKENIQKIFNNRATIEDYILGTPIKNSILWIVMHGEYIKDPTSVKIVTSLTNPHSDSTAKLLELDNEFLFRYDPIPNDKSKSYYYWTKYFQVYFPTYNCLIVCDSCHSNTINLCNIMDGHNNKFLTSGYDSTYLSKSGTTLQKYLIDYTFSNGKSLFDESEKKICQVLYSKYINDDVLFSYISGNYSSDDVYINKDEGKEDKKKRNTVKI